MEPAVSRLEAALAATEIRTPRIPVISNVDAQPHADPDTIKKILASQVSSLNYDLLLGLKHANSTDHSKSQVTSPVLWETTVKTLLTKGLKKSYELGPGKVWLFSLQPFWYSIPETQNFRSSCFVLHHVRLSLAFSNEWTKLLTWRMLVPDRAWNQRPWDKFLPISVGNSISSFLVHWV